jgi:N-acetylmuramoyl-L-alanine amidase
MLKAVRAGQFNESTVRVVLDLGKVRDYKIINLDDPVRIVVDVYGHVAARSTKKRIVIDPGHGGHDPGAIGPNKVMEKDIVLDIALKLKKLLDDDPRFQVFLTRDKDVFIPLPQRTAIANSKDADLFVSIHANSSPRKDARGIETYFLNWTDDEEAMKVAARENQISLRNMKKMKKDNSVLDVIFSDLTRDDKRDKSLQLANYIQNNMVGELGRQYHVVDLRTKWAPFYVLFGADMPSVLVEVSFISNPMEERLLTRDSYRSSLARSIAGGITKFMSVSPDVRTVADVRKSVGSRD